MVFSTPSEGLDAEFNAFYDNQHVHDVLRVPGLVGCRRLKLADPSQGSAAPAPYVALYELDTEDAPGAIQEIRARLGTPQMPKGAFSDDSRRATWLYRIIFETPQAAGWGTSTTPLASKHIFMALRGPAAGDDAAYNRFYNEIHVPEVMDIPGFVGCRRLKLDESFQNSAGAPHYVGLYELNTTDAPASIGELFRRGKAGEFRANSNTGPARGQFLWDVVSERHL
jgi:hypothetical protein